MTQEEFEALVAAVREQVGLLREEVAEFKTELQTQLHDGFVDVQHRVDNVNHTLIDHSQRLSNIEQAIVKLIPTLKMLV